MKIPEEEGSVAFDPITPCSPYKIVPTLAQYTQPAVFQIGYGGIHSLKDLHMGK